MPVGSRSGNPRKQAAALEAAFPQYSVNLSTWRGDGPRFILVGRNLNVNPWCLISPDIREIWQTLKGHRLPSFHVPSSHLAAREVPREFSSFHRGIEGTTPAGAKTYRGCFYSVLS